MHRDGAVMRRLVPEQDNVRQALAWFADHGDAPSLNLMSAAMSIFWPALGQFAEARQWLQRSIADDADVPLAHPRPRLARSRVAGDVPGRARGGRTAAPAGAAAGAAGGRTLSPGRGGSQWRDAGVLAR